MVLDCGIEKNDVGRRGPGSMKFNFDGGVLKLVEKGARPSSLSYR